MAVNNLIKDSGLVEGKTTGYTAPVTSAVNAEGKNAYADNGLYKAGYSKIKNQGSALLYTGANLALGAAGIFEGAGDVIGAAGSLLYGDKTFAKTLMTDNIVGGWKNSLMNEYRPGKVMSFVGDVAAGIGQSATLAIPYVGVPTFYAGVIGNSTGDAVSKTGKLGAKEIAYGAVSGGVEGTLEWATSGVGGALKNTTAALAKNTAKQAVWKGLAKSMIKEGAGEFVEEFIGDYVDTAASRAFEIDPQAKYDFGRAAYSGLVGFTSGALLGGAADGITTAAAYKSGKRVIDEGNATALVNEAQSVADGILTESKTKKNMHGSLKSLLNTLENYRGVAGTGSAMEAVRLGELKQQIAVVETYSGVNDVKNKLANASDAAADAYAKFMSAIDSESDAGASVARKYTADDFRADKDNIMTRYAVRRWATSFLADTDAELRVRAFKDAIDADRAGIAAGQPSKVQRLSKSVLNDGNIDSGWLGGDALYSLSDGKYIKVTALGEDRYSVAYGDSSDNLRGFAGKTVDEVRDILNRAAIADDELRSTIEIRKRAESAAAGSVKNDKDIADNQSTLDRSVGLAKADEQAAIDNLNKVGTDALAQNNAAQLPKEYNGATQDKARRAVKNFDMLDPDTRASIMNWINSVDGKIGNKEISGVANLIAGSRRGLDVIYTDTLTRNSGKQNVSDKKETEATKSDDKNSNGKNSDGKKSDGKNSNGKKKKSDVKNSGGKNTESNGAVVENNGAVTENNDNISNQRVNGMYVELADNNGRRLILVGGEGKDAIRDALAHELAHSVRKSAGWAALAQEAARHTPDNERINTIDAYTDYYIKRLYDGKGQKFSEFLAGREISETLADEYFKQYPKFDRDLVVEEIVARTVGRSLMTPTFLEGFARQNVAERILSAAKRALVRIKAKSGDVSLLNAETQLIRKLDAALALDYIENNTGTAANTDVTVRHSLDVKSDNAENAPGDVDVDKTDNDAVGAKGEQVTHADMIERRAEIEEISEWARNNHDLWYDYTDLARRVKSMVTKVIGGKVNIGDVTFTVFRALNSLETRFEGDTARISYFDTLAESIISAANEADGVAERYEDIRIKRVSKWLQNMYEKLAHETLGGATHRADVAKKTSEKRQNMAELMELSFEVQRRIWRKKTQGVLDTNDYRALQAASKQIRIDGKHFRDSRLSYVDCLYFNHMFLEFAKAQATQAYNVVINYTAEAWKAYAEARSTDMVLSMVTPDMIIDMIALENTSDVDFNDENIRIFKNELKHLMELDRRYDRVFRNGQLIDTANETQAVLSELDRAYAGKPTQTVTKEWKKLVRSGFLNLLDPEDAVHRVEGVLSSGIIKSYIHDVKLAQEMATHDYNTFVAPFDNFVKENAKWWEEWNTRKIQFKITLPDFNGSYTTQSVTLTCGEAAQLYMTSKRTHARDALCLGAIEIGDATDRKGDEFRSRILDTINIDNMPQHDDINIRSLILAGEPGLNAAIDNMCNNFSEIDMKYIEMLERFYEKVSKVEKLEADTKFFGTTNVYDGYYIPIIRSGMARDFDLVTSNITLRDNVSIREYAFNKMTANYARSRLLITDATEVMTRHARQLAMYKHLTLPMQNLSRVYNHKNDLSVAKVFSVRDYIAKYVWGGFDDYITKYFADVQGRNVRSDLFSRSVRKLKGGIAVSALGANVGSVIKQLSTIFSAFTVTSPKIWMRGYKFANLGKMTEYSPVAANRASRPELYYAAGASGKLGKLGTITMKGLEYGDAVSCGFLWSVAQYQAEVDGHGAVGSDENMKSAGHILDDYILMLQDTSGASTKSGLARHPQEMMSAMTMFQSANIKITSRLATAALDIIDAKREKKQIEAGEGNAQKKDEIKKCDKIIADNAKLLGKIAPALLATALLSTIVGLTRHGLRGDEDDKDKNENLVMKIAKNTGLELIGMIPVAGAAAETLLSGYDASNYAYDFINDALGTVGNIGTMSADLLAGKPIKRQTVAKNLRAVAYLTGQLTGIPVRNVNNIVLSLLNSVSKSAGYVYRDIYTEQPYVKDYAAAVSAGKTRLAETIYRLMAKSKKTGVFNTAVADEIVRLGNAAVPKSTPTYYTNDDGESVPLTRRQIKAFREIYSEADAAAQNIIITDSYAALDDATRAKALSVTYDIYHSRARNEVLGGELSVMAALSCFEDVIDIPTLICESATIYGINKTEDKTRSELVREYVAGRGYGEAAAALLLRGAGLHSSDIIETLTALTFELDEDERDAVSAALLYASAANVAYSVKNNGKK